MFLQVGELFFYFLLFLFEGSVVVAVVGEEFVLQVDCFVYFSLVSFHGEEVVC